MNPRSSGSGAPEPDAEASRRANSGSGRTPPSESGPTDGTAAGATRSVALLSPEMMLAVLGVVLTVAALSRSAFLLAAVLLISVGIVVAALRYLPRRRSLLVGAVALAVVLASTGVWLFADDGEDPPTTANEAVTVGVGAPAATAASPNMVPFDVAVTTAANPCGTGFIVPRPPDDIAAPPLVESTDEEKMAWAKRVDGVVATSGSVLLNIQGKSDAQVTLLGMEVRTQRAQPLVGTQMTWICGGPDTYRWVTVRLDKTPVAIEAEVEPDVIDGAPPQERRPIKFPYRVSLSDAETFLVIPETDDCDCQWEILLRWASSGRNGVQIINDHGRPFRTTGTRNATATCTQLGDRVDCGPPRR